ncbi:hypothetical protein WBP07_12500 [Novosphingobium sp. BL-8A]|uniref:hypothetical protein n=1 Tax=Novosphingobium sp. BL-8A TaxID=3127639 RepID=UPI0037570193
MIRQRHRQPHPLAGRSVVIASGSFEGHSYWIEDWWDRIAGQSWMDCDGNPACLEYAMRSGFDGDPINDDVVYGKVGSFGKLMHVRHLPAEETVDG